MYRAIEQVIVQDQSVLVAFENYDLQLFRYDTELNDLALVKTEKTFDHEQEITSLGVHPSKNLFLTGSLDGYVKVWNIQKELIREIKFPESVFSVTFLNEKCDLLIGHQGKVSTVSAKDYVPEEMPKKVWPS
jgi:WD40 repeat protein